ncbi:polyketide synthase dehydratase domain-containing protein, partial [Streptomyces sp. NPDC093991]
DEVGCGHLTELTLQTPLTLSDDAGVHLQVVVGAADPTGQRELTIYSRPENAASEEPWTLHAEGVLDAAPAEISASALVAWPPAGAESIDVSTFYADAEAAGYGYGPAFQGLRAAWRRGGEVFAEVALPEERAGDAAAFGIHPALLDAALHANGYGDFGATDESLRLPFAWTGVSLHAAGADRLRVRITAAGDDALTVEVADSSGQPVAEVRSLVLRPVAAEQLSGGGAPADEALFRMEWTELPVLEEAGATETWALLGAEDRFGLGAALQGAGLAVDSYLDLDGIGVVVDAGVPAPGLVFSSPGGRAGADGALTDAARQVTTDVLGLLQGWLADERLTEARLVLVTRGAVAAGNGEGVRDLATAPVWGLVRSAQSENPGRFLLVDLDPDTEADRVAEAVAAALAAGESQVALRGDTVLVPRLARAVGAGGALVPPAGERAWRLDMRASGTLENLALLPCPEALEPLAAGQVRVAVRAAGMNFRDVLISLGMYPGQPILGSEAAGFVVEVGAGVTHVAPGDRVLGIVPHGFGPFAVTDGRMLARMPEGWSFEQAASVPVVFLT